MNAGFAICPFGVIKNFRNKKCNRLPKNFTHLNCTILKAFIDDFKITPLTKCVFFKRINNCLTLSRLQA